MLKGNRTIPIVMLALSHNMPQSVFEADPASLYSSLRLGLVIPLEAAPCSCI